MTEPNPSMQYFVHKYCSEDWQLTPNIIDFYDLTFVLEGGSVYYSRDSAFLLHPGEAIFLRKGELRAAETKGMRCAAFSFQLEGELPWSSGILRWNHDEQLMHWLLEYEKKWFSLDENRKIACKGIFLLILHRLMELTRQDGISPHTAEIHRYLASHFTEKITVAEVAAHMGLHPTYCGAIFKRDTGRTILQTVNLLRVNHAAELLRYGGTRVTEAAQICGYSDIFYFSRVFKAIKGRSPEAFAREAESFSPALSGENTVRQKKS